MCNLCLRFSSCVALCGHSSDSRHCLYLGAPLANTPSVQAAPEKTSDMIRFWERFREIWDCNRAASQIGIAPYAPLCQIFYRPLPQKDAWLDHHHTSFVS